MANTVQAKKRARQNEARRQANASRRSTMRTYLKRVHKAIAARQLGVVKPEFLLMTSVIDKMVAKGLIHKNKAARHKSRLSQHIKALSV